MNDKLVRIIETDIRAGVFYNSIVMSYEDLDRTRLIVNFSFDGVNVVFSDSDRVKLLVNDVEVNSNIRFINRFTGSVAVDLEKSWFNNPSNESSVQSVSFNIISNPDSFYNCTVTTAITVISSGEQQPYSYNTNNFNDAFNKDILPDCRV